MKHTCLKCGKEMKDALWHNVFDCDCGLRIMIEDEDACSFNYLIKSDHNYYEWIGVEKGCLFVLENI